jgi:glycosyltransferase involved in cell wall biosynthesis
MRNGNDRSIRPLRVLQIILGPQMGGIETQTLAFLQRYDRSTFAVDVCCTGGVDGPLREQFLAADARLLPCPWSGYVVPFAVRLTRLLRRERYDVVHARMSEVSGTAMLAARLSRVPIRVASYHNTETWKNPSFAKRLAVALLQRLTRRWATNILGVSRAVLDAYFADWSQHPEQFSVCYNGIDLQRFREGGDRRPVRREFGIPPEVSVVGNVGRFHRQKNHRLFVEVAGRVAKLRGDVRFLLVGDGPLRPGIEAQVARHGLSDRFAFAGARADVERMLAAMDVFLLPSLHEGLGNVVIEAQAVGIPVVASALPAVCEALCPELRALTCDPRDAAGMADKILSLINDAERAVQLGRVAREFVAERFSIERTVAQLERTYSGEGRIESLDG